VCYFITTKPLKICHQHKEFNLQSAAITKLTISFKTISNSNIYIKHQCILTILPFYLLCLFSMPEFHPLNQQFLCLKHIINRFKMAVESLEQFLRNFASRTDPRFASAWEISLLSVQGIAPHKLCWIRSVVSHIKGKYV